MGMLETIARVCDRCHRPLEDDQFRLSMTTAAGTRGVYECPCGAVTVTVIADERTSNSPRERQ